MAIKLPNLFLVGAAKCGTTSLYEYLNQHPQIFMSPLKEPMYFVSEIYTKLSRNDPSHPYADDNVVTTLEQYSTLFSQVEKSNKIIGEASAVYLYHYEAAIKKIKQHINSPVKIVIIIRNPVDRAYSSYFDYYKKGYIQEDFLTFLGHEQKRIIENWDIHFYPVAAGLYYHQIKAYVNAFNDVYILLFDNFKSNPIKEMKKIYRFLGIDSGFKPETKIQYNVSGIPKYQALNTMLKTKIITKSIKIILKRFMRENNIKNLSAQIRQYNTTKPKLDQDTRDKLISLFKDDIIDLEKLIFKDLSIWYQ